MWALLGASLIWAFSFGLIKTQLARVPPHLVAFLRLALSTLLFVPWCRPGRIPRRTLAMLLLCGAVQYGVMYVAYLASFGYLKASEVALWTIFTPVYVVLLADLCSRGFRARDLLAAAVSVAGAWVVSRGSGASDLIGIALVQLSNLAFAAGQVWYRRLLPLSVSTRDSEVFASLYLGSTLLTAIPVGVSGGMLDAVAALTATQMATILYLGLVPSGLGFFLWNVGVRRSREGTAAVFNNAKVPLAIAVSWLIFEPFPTLENLARTLLALALITAAVWLTETSRFRDFLKARHQHLLLPLGWRWPSPVPVRAALNRAAAGARSRLPVSRPSDMLAAGFSREGSTGMLATAFWKAVTMDRSEFLDRLIALLDVEGIRYCIVGGQAVNAYAEPVVSLDLDLVIAVDDLARAEARLAAEFSLDRHPHSLNVAEAGSDLRVQIQTDPRYLAYVDRAAPRMVLGIRLPVAALEDVLQGKIWAASDPARRPSKRLKDLADIARLLEAAPHLRPLVPSEILAKIT